MNSSQKNEDKAYSLVLILRFLAPYHTNLIGTALISLRGKGDTFDNVPLICFF